jgi:nitrate/nitrite transport system permease protein
MTSVAYTTNDGMFSAFKSFRYRPLPTLCSLWPTLINTALGVSSTTRTLSASVASLKMKFQAQN